MDRPARAIRTIASLPPSEGSTPLSAAEAWQRLGGDASGTRERPARPSPYQAHFERLASADGNAALVEILLPGGGGRAEGMAQIKQACNGM